MKSLIIAGILLLIAVFSSGCISGDATGSSTYAGNGAKEGDIVAVHYWLTIDGNLFQTTEGNEAFKFRIGAGSVLEDFDKAVRGMKVGEEKEFIIPSERAYPTGELAGKDLHFRIKIENIYG